MTLDLSNVPVVDAGLLSELMMVGGADLHPRLVGIFVDDFATMKEHLKSAVDANDPAALTRAAHRIKGGASAIGAKRVAMVAAELESCGKRAELASAGELATMLVAEVDTLAGS